MAGCRILTAGGAAVGPRLAGASVTIGITPELEGLSVFREPEARPALNDNLKTRALIAGPPRAAPRPLAAGPPQGELRRAQLDLLATYLQRSCPESTGWPGWAGVEQALLISRVNRSIMIIRKRRGRSALSAIIV
jgi:hypothetical protein